jgi:SAM-dependent methyltransferase
MADPDLEKWLGLPLVPAPNLSRGFHPVLFAMMKKWAPSKRALLVSENPAVIPSVQGQLGQDWEVECLGYDGSRGQSYELDLNVLHCFEQTYSVVLSQSLLEHVSRPSIAIENMVRMADPGGIVVIHTVNPPCKYHAYPIDCVRFFPDFWYDLAKYIPYELVWFKEENLNHFAVLRRPEAA